MCKHGDIYLIYPRFVLLLKTDNTLECQGSFYFVIPFFPNKYTLILAYSLKGFTIQQVIAGKQYWKYEKSVCWMSALVLVLNVNSLRLMR